MTNERAAQLLAKWPKEAEHDVVYRWEEMGDFWKAVADTQRVWAEDLGHGWPYVKAYLQIENEEQEKKTCVNGLNLSASSQQLRL